MRDVRTAIPLYDPQPQFAEVREQLMAAAERVLTSGVYVLGPEVEAFEEGFADYLGVRFCIGVNSGTDALTIALRALGIGPGDEVITSAFSFFATAEAIALVGAAPVFADVEGDSFNLSPESVQAHITDRTRAVIPVHLFGLPVDVDSILDLAAAHRLVVVEDAAQAAGALYKRRRVGTYGSASAFSFFPSKNLGGYGDGGLISTDDETVASACRMYRAHGATRKYFNEAIGYNSRLDAFQAALLSVKLPHLERWNEMRRQAAHRYDELLSLTDHVVIPCASEMGKHVYHQYTVRIIDGRRDAVAERLKMEGISTAIYYPVPLHRLGPFEDPSVSLPVAEALAAEVLSLPMWPDIPDATQHRVAETIEQALR